MALPKLSPEQKEAIKKAFIEKALPAIIKAVEKYAEKQGKK